MRFQYAFQKIVDLKTNEKTQAEWMLSQAIVKLREEESTLAKLEDAKKELQEKLHKVSENRTTVSNLLLLQSYVDHIDLRIRDKHQDLHTAKTNVQIRQDDLTGKLLQEKVWTKAKEKAYQKFSAGVLKVEQNRLDEMATNRYQRLS
ncbi:MULTISPECIES: flagellar export protein FliJ [Paenibacillus]|uniref:Flagellar FliJ protein n=1 Tax=Paenibacillus naphthalenovorans TaxID=162209 RepID=A0A0U2VDP0_9BACL|nr:MULTISPECIES: flagellar export protein FliJ [Paenibacillus]ALS21635.1 flagellar export protein FliJ [Paenibacillus naphthalenovorans]NTZ18211.1 flagellar export protein FliJ [Paenibacillus sp. JMULE4]GCL71362.1 flagellar export protein FliJ [Paenibacillus naphthalenovorans]SDI87068.1 flagellar FliJ protein [Paenibacillus naphthalenovorans]